MKYLMSVTMTLIFLFTGLSDVEAQKKRRKKKRTTEREEQVDRPSFTDNLVYEIGVGNPSFLGGSGGSSFNFALKPGVAYKFNKRSTLGTFIKGDYLFVNQNGTEYSLFDYGAGIFGRFKISDAVYLRGEYAYQSYSWNRSTGLIVRSDFFEPLLGLGYASGLGTWTYGAELMFHLDKDVRTYANQIYEFWLKFDYNF